LVTAGNLTFRILADQEMDASLVRRAEGESGANHRVIKDEDQPARKSEPIHDREVAVARNSADDVVTLNGIERARWVTVEADKAAAVRSDPDLITRLSSDGKQIQQLIILGRELAEWMEVGMQDSKVAGQKPTPRIMVDAFTVQRPRDDGGLDVLVKIDDQNVTGGYLSGANAGVSEGRVAVNFNFNVAGAKKFGQLTGANIRQSGRKRRLGIVLDDELLSAPSLNSVIRDSGQITGDFTQDDVDWLVGVLNAGSLPAALNKIPISEQRVEPTLGLATIEAGKRAIGISLIAIALFMPLYYRFSGLVACFALVLNLALVLGVMLAIGATFTLPGLAGLVLTVGMAVDANVLIFERIREELFGGAALRMAIRNGFNRATRTIVDANLTTLITALVLYVIGKDQLRGFAVTLILGIGMSMFTAIFCSRVFFDIAEKRRWITKLGMLRLLGKTNIDFIGKRWIAATFSLALICLGLYGVFLRGPNLFDIDFRGGAKIEVVFAQPTSDGKVFETLTTYSSAQQPGDQLTDLKVVGVGENGFLVETTQADRSLVEDAIRGVFAGELQTNTLSFDPESIAPIAAVEESGNQEGKEDQKSVAGTAAGDSVVPKRDDPFAGGSETQLVFSEPINQEILFDRLEQLVQTLQLGSPRMAVLHPQVFGDSSRRVTDWEFKTTLKPAAAKKLLSAFAAELKEDPVFRSSTNVGGQVAGDTQNQAFVALFASLVFIIGYIWIRFQRVTFGLAAVVLCNWNPLRSACLFLQPF
jgi:SecD/SecF fusion protein